MEDSEIDSDLPQWTALGRIERRVLGVLIEKAKTTPANYPLSLNAVRTGCNQKSNRFPQMDLEDRHIEEAIDTLRERKAVSIIQGDARVEKYRHLAYEWLGVSKVELAVMAELLLRGAQTIGELRGRAARMEPIKGMSELMPILDGLMQKNLVVYLTPPGRGASVTHNLYEPQELEKVQREFGPSTVNPQPAAPSTSVAPAAPSHPAEEPSQIGTPSAAGDASDLQAELAALRTEFQEQLSELRSEVEDLRQRIQG
ncbi:MAG: DUF480 domain-containing protein [Planctomycetota bacterium]